MKIGFFGAGGTGKTTLAQMLSATTGLPFQPSTTRDVFAKYGKTQKDLPHLGPVMRKVIQQDNFKAKMAHDAAHPKGIFDRTLLDHLMYVMTYCSDTLSDDEFQQGLFDTWTNLRSYDLLFYSPIYPWAENPEDGFREAGFANRTLQQIILQGLLGVMETRFSDKLVTWTLPNQPVDQRLNYVLNVIHVNKSLSTT